MKRYRVTLERTVRATRWIEAENDQEAMEIAKRMHYRTDDSEYENGESDSEYDYALMDENGRDLVYFDN